MLELACFSARPDHVAALRRHAGPLVRALREQFPGLRSLYIARLPDGRWLNVGIWDDRAGAEAAADGMFEVPEMSDWLAHVGEFAVPA